MTEELSWQREAGQGKYARPERERRFLVTGEVPPRVEVRRIEDRYVDGTRLRLRRVLSEGTAVHKLTQKVRVHDDDPADVMITNTYLSPEEYDVLAALPAAVLVKTRGLVIDRVTWAVDVFEEGHAGLVLAEVEVDDLSAELLLPYWVGDEVTHDDRYAGGTLARRA